MVSVRASHDPAGRWLGLAVFLLGITFLALVFLLAYRDLTSAGVLGRLTSPSPSTDAANALGALAIKGVLFFVMAYAGSAVAGRGIGMYAAARATDEG